jgi:hypothetical protein
MSKLSEFQKKCLRWVLLKVVVNHELPFLFHELRKTLNSVWWEDNQPTNEALLRDALHSPNAQFSPQSRYWVSPHRGTK